MEIQMARIPFFPSEFDTDSDYATDAYVESFGVVYQNQSGSSISASDVIPFENDSW